MDEAAGPETHFLQRTTSWDWGPNRMAWINQTNPRFRTRGLVWGMSFGLLL